MPREYYLEAPCNNCGARVGMPCVGKNGKNLPPSLSHKARKDEYDFRQNMAAADNEVHTSKVSEALEKTVNKLQAVPAQRNPEYLDLRNEKIAVFLFGIGLARRMGLSQDQIDRRLAEMFADQELAGK